MADHSYPLAFMALLFAAGAGFMMWRTAVAFRRGSIWLGRQNVERSEEPAWFWAYLATYLAIISGLVYAAGQVLLF